MKSLLCGHCFVMSSSSSNEFEIRPPTPPNSAVTDASFASDPKGMLFEQLFGSPYETAPHAPITEAAALMSSVKSFFPATKADNQAEMIFTHLIHICTLRTKWQFATALLALASSVTNGTLRLHIMGVFKNKDQWDPQAGETEEASLNDTLRRAYGGGLDGFELFKDGALARRFKRMFAYCVAAGALGQDFEEKVPGLYRRLSDGIDKNKMDYSDLVMEILHLIRVSWDVISEACVTNSMRPFFSVAGAAGLDHAHAEILAWEPMMLNGTLQRVTKLTNPEFMLRVARHLDAVNAAHAKTKSGAEKAVLRRMQQQIITIDAHLKEFCTRDPTRVEPIAIKLFGPTACGKSSVQVQMIRDSLRIAGLPFSDDHIAFLNGAEQYMSTIYNHTTGVIIDDVCNTKAQFAKTDPMGPIIAIKNVSKAPVAKAALEDKGTVTHNAGVLLCSTNVPDLEGATTSNAPSTIQRRFDFHIEVSVDPAYAKSGQRVVQTIDGESCIHPLPTVDPSKLTEGINTHFQRFNVYEYIPRDLDYPGQIDNGGIHHKILDNKNYSELMMFLKPRIETHFRQKRLMYEQQKAAALDELCVHGHTTTNMCHLCRRDAAAAALAPPAEFLTEAGEAWERFAVWGDGATDFLFGRDLREQIGIPMGPPPDEAPREPLLRRLRVRERLVQVREAFQTPAAEPAPPRPAVVGWWDAYHQGSDSLEDAFIRHPGKALTVVYGVVPAGVAVATGGVVALFGFSTLCAVTAGLCGQIWFIAKQSSTIEDYARHRIAGMTLGRLRNRMATLTKVHGAQLILGLIAVLTSLYLGKKIVAACTPEPRRKPDRAPPDPHDYDGQQYQGPAVSPTYPPGSLNLGVQHRLWGSDSPPSLARHSVTMRRSSVRCFPPSEAGEISECDEESETEPTRREVFAAPKCAFPYTGEPEELEAESFVPHGGCVAALADIHPRSNQWKYREQIALSQYVEGNARGMSYEQAMARITRQLYVVEVHYETQVVVTQALMLCTNYALLPAHNFFRPDVAGGRPVRSKIKHLLFTSTGAAFGPTFKCLVGESTVRKLSNDLAVVQTNVGGSMADVVPFLANADQTAGAYPVVELNRVRDGEQDYAVEMSRYNVERCVVDNKSFGWMYHGYQGVRPLPSYKGVCGAPLIVPGSKPVILAVHTMGHTSSSAVQSAPVDRAEVIMAIEALRASGPVKGPPIEQVSTTLHTPAEFEMQSQLEPLHDGSVLRETSPGVPYIVAGTLTFQRSNHPHSRLRVSPFSSAVELLCEQPRLHGPPVHYGQKGVEARHVREVETYEQLDPDLLVMAQEDYFAEHVAVMDACPEVVAQMRPLDNRQTVVGVAGCSSINRIPMSTSAGWPHLGPKRKLMRPDPLPDDPDGMVLDEPTQKEMDEVEEIYASGRRANLAFKLSQKDEPLKAGKKVRVFKGGSLVLNCIFRKYFLPLFRLYALFPFILESAVGINASGAEWHALAEWLMEYDREKAIVGDWVHYDQSLAYQEMMAICSIWIAVAQYTGNYSDRDISIMWGVAEDIARAWCVIRSDQYQTDGGNPSGNAGTVYFNNGTNALRMRCAFYFLASTMAPLERDGGRDLPPPVDITSTGGFLLRAGYRKKHCISRLYGLKGSFADYVRATFYGDDHVLTVRSGLEWFNQIDICRWFATQGKTLTDTAKQPISQPYTVWGDVSFLKRLFRFDSELGKFLAPLEIVSIYKPMHVINKVLPFGIEAHYAELIMNAQRELFQHGRVVYNEHAPGLRLLAQEIGCSTYLLSGDVVEYDVWRDNYVSSL